MLRFRILEAFDTLRTMIVSVLFCFNRMHDFIKHHDSILVEGIELSNLTYSGLKQNQNRQEIVKFPQKSTGIQERTVKFTLKCIPEPIRHSLLPIYHT